MTRYTGHNSKATRRTNRTLILRILFEKDTASRMMMKEAMGLSQAAITFLTQELLEVGLIKEVGVLNIQEGAGRRPQELALVPDARYIIGFELRGHDFKIGLFNLKIKPLQIVQESINPGEKPLEVLQRAAKIGEDLLEEFHISRSRVLGVGIGIAGIVDIGNGIIKLLPGFGWKDFPISARFSELTGLPVVVNNNVQNMVMAECWLGKEKNKENLLVLHVGSGVAMGVIIGGRPFYGNGMGAGQIGHVVVSENGPPCRCGRSGCLEALVAEPSLLKKAREKGLAPDLTIKQLIDLAYGGNAVAEELLTQAGRHLGTAIINIHNIYGPMDVILSGTIFQSGEKILHSLFEVMNSDYAVPVFKSKLELTTFPGELGIYGAATSGLLELFLNPNSVCWDDNKGSFQSK